MANVAGRRSRAYPAAMKHVALDARTLRRLVEIDAARTRAAAERLAFIAGRPCAFEEGTFGAAIALSDAGSAEHGFLNRVVGFTAAELEHLDALGARYAAIGAACQIDLTPDVITPALLRALEARRFRWMGGLVMFRGAPELVEVDPAFAIARVEDATTAAHALAVRAAVRPDEWAPDEARDARWREHVFADRSLATYVALLDGRPAGIAAALFTGDACHLSNFQTDPALRGRGCQAALLAFTEREAAKAGCRLVVTDTFFGTSSHRNVERAGYQAAYMSAWMARPLATTPANAG
jgi:GNAT superfamily N-acetyltransferase